MSQHNFQIQDQSGASFLPDLNNALQALASVSRGTTEPATTYAGQYWEDTTATLLKRRNSANSGWVVVGSLVETFVLSRSSDTILNGADYGRTFVGTGSYTQTFTAAATLADGWHVFYRNDGSGVITLDPNASETIDGATTIDLQPGESCRIACNGSAFKTQGRAETKATLASPALTGNPTAPTPAFGDSDTSIATTAFVQGRSIVKRKTADDTRTGGLTNDSDLFVAIAANEEWMVVVDLDVNHTGAGSSGGLSVGVTVPSGATLNASGFCVSAKAATSSGIVDYARVTAGGSFLDLIPSVGTVSAVHAKIWVLNGANAGNIQIQTGKATGGGATSTIFFKGSILTAHRIA